jgi:hypothetical protein
MVVAAPWPGYTLVSDGSFDNFFKDVHIRSGLAVGELIFPMLFAKRVSPDMRTFSFSI